MPAKINHIAIVSQEYALLSYFYQTVFGMRTSPNFKRPGRAITVGDGFAGLNINPRKAGRPAGLDHFGVEVDDTGEVLERLRAHEGADHIERPSTRPFAGITANDPDGNIFDLSQKKMANRAGIYVENDGAQNPRRISHIALRTRRPDGMARFYQDVFGFAEAAAKPGDPNHYLSGGKVTLVIIPWRIRDYEGTNILAPGLDHIGFSVEDAAALKRDIEAAIDANPAMQGIVPGRGIEGAARLELARRQAPYADFFIGDPDFTLVAVSGRG